MAKEGQTSRARLPSRAASLANGCGYGCRYRRPTECRDVLAARIAGAVLLIVLGILRFMSRALHRAYRNDV